MPGRSASSATTTRPPTAAASGITSTSTDLASAHLLALERVQRRSAHDLQPRLRDRLLQLRGAPGVPGRDRPGHPGQGHGPAGQVTPRCSSPRRSGSAASWAGGPSATCATWWPTPGPAATADAPASADPAAQRRRGGPLSVSARTRLARRAAPGPGSWSRRSPWSARSPSARPGLPRQACAGPGDGIDQRSGVRHRDDLSPWPRPG